MSRESPSPADGPAATGNRTRATDVPPAVGYSLVTPMRTLMACPFCREMFEAGEARSCPECGLALKRLEELPQADELGLLHPLPRREPVKFVSEFVKACAVRHGEECSAIRKFATRRGDRLQTTAMRYPLWCCLCFVRRSAFSGKNDPPEIVADR